MSESDDVFEMSDDDDVELLEDHNNRGTRENFDPDHSNKTSESHTMATHSRKTQFRKNLDHFRAKTLSQRGTNEETRETSKPAPEDGVMTDAVIDHTETEDYIKLPSLRHIMPKPDYTPKPEENIDRPYFNDWAYHKGFVAYWDNRTGKGIIVNPRFGSEHKIELQDIRWSNYGALVPGSMVEYEYYEDGFSKSFSKFWVVSGCEYVL